MDIRETCPSKILAWKHTTHKKRGRPKHAWNASKARHASEMKICKIEGGRSLYATGVVCTRIYCTC